MAANSPPCRRASCSTPQKLTVHLACVPEDEGPAPAFKELRSYEGETHDQLERCTAVCPKGL